MRKLNYWVSVCLTDHKCFSYRAKTKREVLAKLKEGGLKFKKLKSQYCDLVTNGYFRGDKDTPDYEPIKRVSIPYKDAFDLVDSALGEGGCE